MNIRQLKKMLFLWYLFVFVAIVEVIWLWYAVVFQSRRYEELLKDHQYRERAVKAPRGKIYDRNGLLLAGNKAVCSISVIYSQVKEPETVIQKLSEILEMEEAFVRKRVKKRSSREIIKRNVEKETANQIRELELEGVKVDEDYQRMYPYDELCSTVLGFAGGDNQGIIGLEVAYDSVLKGKDGAILTMTDARGIEVRNAPKERKEAVPGKDMTLSIDVHIQKYAQQICEKVKTAKQAKRVSMIIMNPQNGEIYGMVNVPEFDLNHPYQLQNGETATQEELNQMWRNWCINDSYEPGSTFKIVTATAGLETGAVTMKDTFSCPGFRIVEDRRIRCHKTSGHGGETFLEGIMNSCNPVFMDVAARVGRDQMYAVYKQLGLFEKTGIDVPGEANSIMHKKAAIGAVELATMSFGQSIQITPLQLLRAASAVVNGGKLVTPHFVTKIDGKEQTYPVKEKVIKKETSEKMKMALEAVVSEGSGKRAGIDGYRIGGKTATSEKLPRGNGKYISSFLGFASAENPTVMALILIDEPEGVYYGGTIAAPAVKELFQNILPYLGMKEIFAP